MKKIIFLIIILSSALCYSQSNIIEYESILQNSEDAKARADAANQLANIYLFTQDSSAAVNPLKVYDYLKQAEELSRKADYAEGLAEVYYLYGSLFYIMDKYNEAVKYKEKALKIFTDSSETDRAFATNSSIASIYESWGDYLKDIGQISSNDGMDNARKKYTKSLEYLKKARVNYSSGPTIDSVLAGLSLNIANIYLKNELPDSAYSNIQQTLKLLKNDNDNTQIIDIIANLFTASEDSLNILLNQMQTTDSTIFINLYDKNKLQMLADAFNRISHVLIESGKYTEFIEPLNDFSRQIYLHLDLKPKIAEAMYYQSKRLLNIGFTKEAIDTLRSTLKYLPDDYDYLTRHDLDHIKLLILNDLVVASMNNNNYQDAAKYFNQFNTLKNQIFNRSIRRMQAERELKSHRIEFEKTKEVVQKKEENIKQQQEIILKKQQQIIIFIIALVVFAALALLIYKFYSDKKKHGKILADKNDELEIANYQLEKSQKELKIAKDAADQANQHKSEFLANMSHEIRTPMNAIIGFTSQLKSKSTDPKSREYLDIISSSGQTLMNIINDILDISKIEAGKIEIVPEPISLRSVAGKVEKMFVERFENKGIALKKNIDERIPSAVMADSARLEQMIINLVGNAIKFTYEGSVTIAIDLIEIRKEEKKCHIEISVEDTGIGIPDEQQDKIFGAFEQRKGQSAKQYGGTGLGLAITKKLSELMGGSIRLESKENVGSKFIIVLPELEVSESEIAEKSKSDMMTDSINFHPAKLLLTDDNQINRQLIIEYLSDSDFEIHEAENGREALSAVEKIKPDIIIMDLVMPEMDGLEASKRLKSNEKTKNIPLLIISGSALKDEEEKVLQAGVDEFLRKPVQKFELFNSMMKYLKYDKTEQAEPDQIEDDVETEDSIKIPDEIPEETRKELPNIIENLKGELLDKSKELQTKLRLGSVGQFADHITKIGEKNGIKIVYQYGSELKKHVDNFETAIIKTKLNEYQKMVGKLEELA